MHRPGRTFKSVSPCPLPPQAEKGTGGSQSHLEPVRQCTAAAKIAGILDFRLSGNVPEQFLSTFQPTESLALSKRAENRFLTEGEFFSQHKFCANPRAGPRVMVPADARIRRKSRARALSAPPCRASGSAFPRHRQRRIHCKKIDRRLHARAAVPHSRSADVFRKTRSKPQRLLSR